MHFSKISLMKLKLWSNYLDDWIKVSWMKVERAVRSAMSLNKRKYLRNISLRLLIPWAIVYYDALIDFIGHYLKRDRQI